MQEEAGELPCFPCYSMTLGGGARLEGDGKEGGELL